MSHKVIVIEGGRRVEQGATVVEGAKIAVTNSGTGYPSGEVRRDEKFMLRYCRKYIPHFAEMHDRVLASRNGTIVQGKAGK